MTVHTHSIRQIALANPIKQGQTPYNHLVISFEEAVQMEAANPFKLNVTEYGLLH